MICDKWDYSDHQPYSSKTNLILLSQKSEQSTHHVQYAAAEISKNNTDEVYEDSSHSNIDLIRVSR